MPLCSASNAIYPIELMPGRGYASLQINTASGMAISPVHVSDLTKCRTNQRVAYCATSSKAPGSSNK